jgi:hypothetical protein
MAVLVDTAAVLSVAEFPAGVGRGEVQGLLERAVGQLGEPGRVRGLARQGREEASGLEDVMLTNSFGVSVGGEGFIALFRDLAVSEYYLMKVVMG